MDETNDAVAGSTEDDLVAAFAADADEQDGAQDSVEQGDGAEVQAGDVGDEQEAAQDDSDGAGEDDGEGADAAEPDPNARHKVLVKNDKGEVVEEKVSFKDLRDGYQRGRDYDALRAQAEHVVTQTRQQAIDEIGRARQSYDTELSTLRALVNQAMDIVSPEQLVSLASSDPQAYSLALQKQQMLHGIQSKLADALSREAEQRRQQEAQQQQRSIGQQRDRALNALKAEGITSQAVQKLYDEAGPLYGYRPEELSPNLDHRLVLLLKDAAEYRRLKAKGAEVAKKVQAAPKLSARAKPMASKPAAKVRTRDDLASVFESM